MLERQFTWLNASKSCIMRTAFFVDHNFKAYGLKRTRLNISTDCIHAFWSCTEKVYTNSKL